MSTPAEYATAAKFQPDCECCEIPANEVWIQPHKGIFAVINELTGDRKRVCGACLEAGLNPFEFFESAAPTEAAPVRGDPNPATARA